MWYTDADMIRGERKIFAKKWNKGAGSFVCGVSELLDSLTMADGCTLTE